MLTKRTIPSRANQRNIFSNPWKLKKYSNSINKNKNILSIFSKNFESHTVTKECIPLFKCVLHTCGHYLGSPQKKGKKIKKKKRQLLLLEHQSHSIILNKGVSRSEAWIWAKTEFSQQKIWICQIIINILINVSNFEMDYEKATSFT